MGRCVARSPKEMVRQVAAARELDEAEVSFANDNSLSLISSLQGGLELPANWQPGDQALPVDLEDKRDFLGLDAKQSEEERAGYMGEPKVEQ